MVWYPYYSRGARNITGAAVASGTGKFYQITDQAGTGTAVTTRALDQANPGSGLGAVLVSLTVVDYTTPDFEAEVEEGWFKSGTAPAIYLYSAKGLQLRAQAAATAAEAAAAGITTGLNARVRNRGTWAPNTAYIANDLFRTAAGNTYLVLSDHTSGATAPTVDSDTYVGLGGGGGGSTAGVAYASQSLKVVYRTGVNRDGPWPARDNAWYQHMWIGVDPNPTDMAAWDLRGRY